MVYNVMLNGLSEQEGAAWVQAMTRAGHHVVTAHPAPVPVANGAAKPAHTLPLAGLGAPPAVAGLTWQRADNGNGYKAPDPVFGRDVMWLYNDDGRPMADGTSGAYVVKARVLGQWLGIEQRAELLRNVGAADTALGAAMHGAPSTPTLRFPARRRR